MKKHQACYVGQWIDTDGKDKEFFIFIESHAAGAINDVCDAVMKIQTNKIHSMDIGPASAWVVHKDD